MQGYTEKKHFNHVVKIDKFSYIAILSASKKAWNDFQFSQ